MVNLNRKSDATVEGAQRLDAWLVHFHLLAEVGCAHVTAADKRRFSCRITHQPHPVHNHNISTIHSSARNIILAHNNIQNTERHTPCSKFVLYKSQHHHSATRLS
jgi:hypothetical protein